MSLLAAIRVALDALLVNKGRSVLTSLGIVIGIMAVIAMVAAGAGAREKLDERLGSLGTNLILVRPGGQTSVGLNAQFKPLGNDDAEILREDPDLKRWLTGIAESQLQPTIVYYPGGGTRRPTTLTGGVPQVFAVRSWELAPGGGRFYNDSDCKSAANVCVIGETIRQKLFLHKSNPIGERIRIETPAPNGTVVTATLIVIGVLAGKGKTPTGMDQDDQIFLPITTLQDKLGLSKQVAVIAGSAVHHSVLEPAVQRMTKLLREKHRIRPGQEDDFEVKSIEEMASLAVLLTKTLNILIVVIASISLVVGGIGIMNIMLVSVTERTREIGIRMAVGATPQDIRNQFLIEAVVLSMIGGIIGITLGMGVAVTLASILKWPIFISPFYVGLAFGVAAAVGMFFGIYPAAKASQLDPIDALRYE
jgi:putative ABC transport system permease protein